MTHFLEHLVTRLIELGILALLLFGPWLYEEIRVTLAVRKQRKWEKEHGFVHNGAWYNSDYFEIVNMKIASKPDAPGKLRESLQKEGWKSYDGDRETRKCHS